MFTRNAATSQTNCDSAFITTARNCRVHSCSRQKHQWSFFQQQCSCTRDMILSSSILTAWQPAEMPCHSLCHCLTELQLVHNKFSCSKKYQSTVLLLPAADASPQLPLAGGNKTLHGGSPFAPMETRKQNRKRSHAQHQDLPVDVTASLQTSVVKPPPPTPKRYNTRSSPCPEQLPSKRLKPNAAAEGVSLCQNASLPHSQAARLKPSAAAEQPSM